MKKSQNISESFNEWVLNDMLCYIMYSQQIYDSLDQSSLIIFCYVDVYVLRSTSLLTSFEEEIKKSPGYVSKQFSLQYNTIPGYEKLFQVTFMRIDLLIFLLDFSSYFFFSCKLQHIIIFSTSTLVTQHKKNTSEIIIYVYILCISKYTF